MSLISWVLNRKAIKKAISEQTQELFRSLSTQTNIAPKSIVPFNVAFANLCFAVMYERAKPFAIAKNQVMTVTGKDEILEPINKNHWLYMLFNNRPNPYINWYELKILVSLWLDFYGNAYLWNDIQRGKPNQVWILPSSFIQPKIGTDRLISHYELKQGSFTKIYPIEEIIHFKTQRPNPFNFVENFVIGQPLLLQAAAVSVGADKELVEYLHSFFERDTIPPLVMTTDKTLTTSEWETKKQTWNVAFKDYKLTGLIEDGAKIQALPGSVGNASFSSLKVIDDSMILRICSDFGVPPAWVQTKFANKATAEVVANKFFDFTLEPLILNYEETLANYYSQYDDKIDFFHKPFKYIDPDREFANAIELYKAGVITRNELRTSQGLESIEGGDIYLFDGNYKTLDQILTTDVSEPPSTKPKQLKDEVLKVYGFLSHEWKDIPESVKVAHWKKYDAMNSKEADEIEKDVIIAFEKMHRDLKKKLKAFYNKDFAGTLIKSNLLENLNMGVSVDDWELIMIDETEVNIKKLIKKVLNESLKDVGSNLTESDFAKEIRKMTKDSTDRIKLSANTAAEDLGKTIKQVIDDNPLASSKELLDEISKRIDYKFNDVYTESRAKMIARTTATYSNGSAQSSAWSKVGLKMSWLSRRDKKVRKDHDKADGQLKRNIGANKGKYHVDGEWLTHPGAGTIAANNVNCRCQQFPRK